MANIVETSIKKPLLIVVVFLVLTVGGFITYNFLSLNLLPKFELPMFTIQTIYPGAGASEVETSVTKKIEDAISTLEDLKNINSTSIEGISIISVELNEGGDANLAVQEAQRKISAIRSDLPADMLDPSIKKISMDEEPILNIAASSLLPATQFYKLVEDRILPSLSKLNGVGSVDMNGGTQREIRVNINAEKIKAYRLSIGQVLQAIQVSNVEIPAGNVETQNSVYSVRLAAQYTNLDQIRNTIIVATADGGGIKIKDVAEVHDGIAEQKLINRMNGRDAIGISVQKQSDANSVRVADMVKAELNKMEKEYNSDNLKFEIATDDSIYTRASADSVVSDLILAIIIVSIVCFIFLNNLRSALIVMITIPLSLIPTFAVMYIMGFSLNMMSLMALGLVVGILVDDSIVVIENMYHHLEMGKSKFKAALDGCTQIMFTCIAMTLVLVVVFMPLAISGGLIGNILKEFAIPIVSAVIFSILVSFTVTPLLMSRFGKLPELNWTSIMGQFSLLVDGIINSLKNLYGKALAATLRHKFAVLVTSLALLIGSVMLVSKGFIGNSFIPQSDKGEFTVTLEMNPQVTIYQNNQTTMLAEKVIRQIPEVTQVYTKVGLSGNNKKNNASTIAVKIIDVKERSISVEECAVKAKEAIMREIPGIKARANISGSSEPIQIIVQGVDYEKVQTAANQLLDIVRKTPGTTDVRFSIDDPRQEVQMHFDREKMANVGLTVGEVGSLLRTTLNGNDKSKYKEGGFEYNIRIGIDGFDRTSLEDVSHLSFLNSKGESVELGQVAELSYGIGASALERTDRISSITVKSNVVGRSSGTVGAEILEEFNSNMPEGITLKKAGVMAQQDSAFSSLIFAFIAALALIYLILVVLYDSLFDPIVVLVSVPLSLIGAFTALALTMNDLTIFSIIGLIVLIGLVAKNAIMLVDFANAAIRTEGLNTAAALIQAGKERLRPIMMTGFSTILGMFPMALAIGNGAEIKNGMAWVIIGGMLSSMILTLFVVPVVYYIFDRVLFRVKRHRRNKLVKKIKERCLQEIDNENVMA